MIGPNTWRISALALLLLSPGCKGPGLAEYDGEMLPQSRSVIDAPKDAPTIVLRLTDEDSAEVTLPDAPVIRVAANRSVPWKRVKATIARIEAAGKRAIPLVGKRQAIKGFVLSDETKGRTIALTATPDGKVCVSPPGVREAKCVQTVSKDRIDRAHTRRLIREAMRAYELYDVDVEVQGDILWADVVRAIDGARTCCSDTLMRIKLND